MNTNSTVVQRVNSLSRAARSGSSAIRARQQSFHESRASQAIMMPALSPFMTEGTITKWMKKEGDSFATGDVLLRIESDIACLDVRAEMPGVLGKILIPDGTSHVPVEKVLAVVARDSQELARLQPPTPRLRHVPPPLLPLNPATPIRGPRSGQPEIPTPIRGSRSAYPELPTPISATSFYQVPSPRAPESPKALRRPSLHFYHPSRLEPSQSNASFLHSATHRSPTVYESTTSASGDTSFMHTNAHQGGAASTRGMIMDHHKSSCPSAGLCESESTIGCEASHSAREAEVAGQDLRRKILASISKGPVESKEYFNGIL